MASRQPPLGGFEALVAAATAAGGVRGGADKGRNKGINVDMIDPALQALSPDATDTIETLGKLLENPSFVNLVASYNAAQQQQRQTTLYAQLLSNMLPADYVPNTPVQQTRSGRISRPPINPSAHPLLQGLTGGILGPTDSGVMESEASELSIQAIKAALENAHGSTIDGLQGDTNNYDSLHDAISPTETEEREDRFWDTHGGLNGQGNQWQADTLLQAEAGPSKEAKGRKKTRRQDEGASDEDTNTGRGGRTGTGALAEGNLPQWPLPPTGKNGRKLMPREEMMARRRARNRVAAVESRKKRREMVQGITGSLKDKDQTVERLQRHCLLLEAQIEQLQQIVQSAGLEVPDTLLAPTMMETPFSLDTPMTNATPNADIPSVQPQLDFDDTPLTTAQTPATDFQMPSFEMFFNLGDLDGENDGDFMPGSSPRRPSASDSSDMDNEGLKKRKKRKGKKRQAEDDEEEDYIDEEVEDEDLFLPIEDVPIPPSQPVEHLTQDVMLSLGVKSKPELADLISRMVNAGQEGMTPDVVEKMKGLLTLMGSQGVWAGQA